jgi:hypothetical protein
MLRLVAPLNRLLSMDEPIVFEETLWNPVDARW